MSQASQEYRIKESVLSGWRDEFLERASQVFEKPGQGDEQARRIAALERLAGDMAVQLEIANKVLGSSEFLPHHEG